MTAIAHTKCRCCAQTVLLRSDGRMKRHPLRPDARERCPHSGHFPLCPFCGFHAMHATVSPDVRVCSDCSRAIDRGEAIAKCNAKGCRDGYTRCEEHCKQGERVCHECGKEGPAPEESCGECEGRGVLYLASGEGP